MAVTISNQAKQLLIVQLNDGEVVYLAPGETSRALDERQVGGNEKLAKLTRDNLVALGQPERAARDTSDAAEADDSAGSRRKPRS
jgi:hypothetical protein